MVLTVFGFKFLFYGFYGFLTNQYIKYFIYITAP